MSNQEASNCKFKKLLVVVIIGVYIVMSGFSVWELEHTSHLVSSAPMRCRLLGGFIISVIIPIVLVFLKRTRMRNTIGKLLELSSVVIILLFYFLDNTVNHNIETKIGDLLSTIFSDVISSSLLFLLHEEITDDHK